MALLGESNKTLRRYLEEVISSVSPDTSKSLIDEESRRLDTSRLLHELQKNDFVGFVTRNSSLEVLAVRDILMKADSVETILSLMKPNLNESARTALESFMKNRNSPLLVDINDARELLGLLHVDWSSRSRKERAKKKPKK